MTLAAWIIWGIIVITLLISSFVIIIAYFTREDTSNFEKLLERIKEHKE